MKNKLKIHSFHHFSVLCCFVISLYSTVILIEDQAALAGTSGNDENYYSIAAPKLFFPSTKSENIVIGADSFSASSEKQTQNEFSFTGRAAEVLLFCKFLKPLGFSGSFVFQFKNTDIIYPFHYFW